MRSIGPNLSFFFWRNHKRVLRLFPTNLIAISESNWQARNFTGAYVC